VCLQNEDLLDDGAVSLKKLLQFLDQVSMASFYVVSVYGCWYGSWDAVLAF
jgi:hypothetical protein